MEEDIPDVRVVPSWKPSSTSAITSSKRASQMTAPDTSTISSTASDHASVSALDDVFGRDLVPYETYACRALTAALREFDNKQNTHKHYGQDDEDDHDDRVDNDNNDDNDDEYITDILHHLPLFKADSLQTALAQATTAIRFNAKWFASSELSELLIVALRVVGTSSSSAELDAALLLLSTVITYSILPVQCLASTAQFLAYTYHQGSRTHRLKRLTKEAWQVVLRLLDSHLGQQLVDAFLDIINSYPTHPDQRSAFGYAQGSLLIVSKLLLSSKRDLSKMNVNKVMASLGAVAELNDSILHEPIIISLAAILADDILTGLLTQAAGWDVLLNATLRCVQNSSKADQAVDKLVQGLSTHLLQLEDRQLALAAQIFIHVDRPTTPELDQRLIEAWTKRPLEPQWSAEFTTFVQQITDSDVYVNLLSLLCRKSLSATLYIKDDLVFSSHVRAWSSAAQRGTSKHAVATLGGELVRAFEESMNFGLPETRRSELLDTLQEIAVRAPAAARILFRLRADVAGELYFLADAFVMQGVPSTQILYAAPPLALEKWLNTVLHALSDGVWSWDVMTVFLDGLPSLLANHKIFSRRIMVIKMIKDTAINLLSKGLYDGMPNDSRPQLLARLIQILTVAVSYHRELHREDIRAIINIFIQNAGSGDYGASKLCIHGLTICCYEVPHLMSSHMDNVIDKMSKMVTQRFLAIHVLQFLASLSRLPELYRNFRQIDYKKIYAVSQSYLQSTRGQTTAFDRKRTPTSGSGLVGGEEALPEYVYALAHHVMAFWYLSMNTDDRRGLKPYITSFLTYRAEDGVDTIEEQGLVTVDLMDRIDADESMNISEEDAFQDSTEDLVKQYRLSGLLLITTETSQRTKRTKVTVRRPSGFAQCVLEPTTRRDQQLAPIASITKDDGVQRYMNVIASDITGEMYGRIVIPSAQSVLGSVQIITLPESDGSRRAIEAIDRTPALDSHKAGVIYIGDGQTTEEEILLNAAGSPDYREFVADLGGLRRLQGARFNTQGLDTINNTDGEHVIVWNNEITEMVFHVTTMIPNTNDVLESTTKKKRHIGNDFVNIIFNNSGTRLTYERLYNIFPSDFGYVYIVVTPSARTSFWQARTHFIHRKEDRFYSIKVLTKPDYPGVSPSAEDKVVSGTSLAGFVRNLALNDCIVSLMKSPRSEPGDYPSSWRNRLQQIRRIGERFGA